jgi:hypothetical protein
VSDPPGLTPDAGTISPAGEMSEPGEQRGALMFNCTDNPFGLDGFFWGWLPTALTAALALLVASVAPFVLWLRGSAGPSHFFGVYMWALALFSVLMALSGWDCKGTPGTVRFGQISNVPMSLLFGFVIHFPQRLITVPVGLIMPDRLTFWMSVAADLLVVAACILYVLYRYSGMA